VVVVVGHKISNMWNGLIMTVFCSMMSMVVGGRGGGGVIVLVSVDGEGSAS